ncbi:hypothetical protein V8D89_011047 [Ganoderma adspersum]
MSSTRYNLRKKALGPRKGAHTGLAPLLGTLPTSSPQVTDGSSDSELSDAPSTRSVASVRPGVSYSQAASTNVRADTGSLHDQETDPRAGADTVSSNEREAYLSIAPQSGTAGSSSLSTSDKENIIHSSSISNARMSENATAAHEELKDEDTGPWTEVRRSCKHRTRTPVQLPVKGGEGQPSMTAELSREQRRTVKAAEESLTKEQCGHIHKGMQKVHRDRAASSSSHGEGPSTFRKGKTVDACNWGAAGIDEEELDPNVQHREFEIYSGRQVLHDNDSDADPDEQQAVLEYWCAMKKAQHSKRPKATVQMDTESSDEDHDFVDEPSRESSVV